MSPHFVGQCRVCERPMVSHHAWKQGHRPEGMTAHGAHGLCRADYESSRPRRKPKPRPRPRRPDDRAPMRSRQEVLEDYMLIRDEVPSLAEAADRMGMTEAALEKALERARKQGVTEARTPNQLRGSRFNQHFNRRSA